MQTIHSKVITQPLVYTVPRMDTGASSDQTRIKCITKYSRNRRKRNSYADVQYMDTIPLTAELRHTRVLHIYNEKLADISFDIVRTPKEISDIVVQFILDSMTIIADTEPTNDDVVKYELMCFPERIPNRIKGGTIDRTKLDVCVLCGGLIEIIVSDGAAACADCGNVVYTDTTLNHPVNFVTMFDSDEHRCIIEKHIYDRVDNIKRHMANVQGIENNNIPDEVYEYIRNNCTDETSDTLQKVLQKRKWGKYFPYRVRIARALWGRQQREYTRTEYTNIIALFAHVCAAYDEWLLASDDTRKNFISYPFVLRQLNTIVGAGDMNSVIMKIRNKKCKDTTHRIWGIILKQIQPIVDGLNKS